jgi:hypothetical protein
MGKRQGVVHTRREATDIPRLKPPAGAKYVIVYCVAETSVCQSLNDVQTHLLGVKLLGSFLTEMHELEVIQIEIAD